MTMTLETAQAHLDAWLAAELKCSVNQEYSVGNRTLKRSDLAEIRQQIVIWQRAVNSLNLQAAGITNTVSKVAKWT